MWNRDGFEPFGCHLLTAAARRVDPTAVVWRGDPTLPADQRGMKVLGTPLGHSEYVDAQLRHITAEHQILLDRIPHVSDLQCAWLLLLFCAASRPNYVLRVLHPDATREFAAHHEKGVRRCLSRLLGVVLPDGAWNLATIPLSLGGMGLRSAIKQGGKKKQGKKTWEKKNLGEKQTGKKNKRGKKQTGKKTGRGKTGEGNNRGETTGGETTGGKQ